MDADVKLLGTVGSNAAERVARAGDVNGDGYEDILVSEHLYDYGTGTDNGAAHLVLGPVTADMELADADLSLFGVSDGDMAGYGLSSAGDTNADGYDDILVGSYAATGGDSESGVAYLVLGPVTGSVVLDSADAILQGESSRDSVAQNVAGGGDLDADGYDDMVISAQGSDATGTDSGVVYIVHGPVTGELSISSVGYNLSGESAGDQASAGVAIVGDNNSDGYDDLLVGAPENDGSHTNAGAAYLVLGPISSSGDLADADTRFLGVSTGDYAGKRVGWSGDIDDDGYDDLLIGAPNADDGGSNSGAVYVVMGPATAGDVDLSAADARIEGEAASDYLGWSQTGAGDVDGDGYGDVMVGTAYDDDGGANAGAVFMFWGPVYGNLDAADADLKLVGESADDELFFAAPAGDQNADGYDDLLLGAAQHDDNGVDAGAAYLVFGGLGL